MNDAKTFSFQFAKVEVKGQFDEVKSEDEPKCGENRHEFEHEMACSTYIITFSHVSNECVSGNVSDGANHPLL